MPLHDINTPDDDDFDDQFDEDILERKIMMLANNHVPNINPSVKGNEEMDLGPDLSTSRWSIYDAFSTTLEK